MNDGDPLLRRIEVVLFLENQLVEDKRLANTTKIPINDLSLHIDKLNELYKKSGSVLSVKKLENFYQLYVDDDYQDKVLLPYQPKKKKLSKAILETLTIVAYKQPVTKIEVDAVRGVNCGNYIKQLFEEGFIELAGRKDVAGKPNMYRTTHKFLVHFGLNSLKDLPSLKEIKTYGFLEDSPNENEK